jgi:RNA polymerase sigma-70 factor (ECF subfamily)
MTTIGNTTQAMQQQLDRLVQGDERAKKDLIDRAYERLILVARKLLGSFVTVRVEEETAGVLSEAYFRLHTSLDDVKPATVRQFMGLAALEIRRVLLDKIRQMKGRGKNKRPDKVSLDARPAGAEDSAAGHEIEDTAIDGPKRDLALDLLEAIDQLPDEEREAVELLFFHGYSQPEAGEILGVHEDTVKRRWSRARIKLAEKLAAFA